ncbi:hypothetical protein BS17DRAFT_786910 [Gyrodon lividus]|nr:hypothetical protein BS17DRAFT_786910 [Gyrodon lividus]
MIPTFVNNGYSLTPSQTLQEIPNQGSYQGGTSGTPHQQQTQLQANRGFASYAPPLPSSAGTPTLGHMVPQRLPTLNVTSTTLPQRPIAATVIVPPSATTRAEPLGPPPRSASSAGSFTDDRRGSGLYSNDRQYTEDKRLGGHDHDRDRDRDWDRRDPGLTRDPRKDPSRAYDRHRDQGWGSRGRGGHRG